MVGIYSKLNVVTPAIHTRSAGKVREVAIGWNCFHQRVRGRIKENS